MTEAAKTRIEIREAGAQDTQAACDLVRASITQLCTADHQNMQAIVDGMLINKTPANMQAWIEAPGSFVLIAEIDGAMAGVGGLTGDGEITMVYVAPEHRFSGVSKALLARLEDRARELGLPNCALVTTDAARPFFLAAGYVGYDPDEDDFGMDGSSMTKEL
ncbi:MAG: GNAT family N-acetyltransferase [Beijerinckiaceae bacterium]|jgi:N-acetylglutamate synthase-like GNAT family acetyltransferase|nr:GNAT family N-acetyltransferase [Beijerinckiaceae bacterium]